LLPAVVCILRIPFYRIQQRIRLSTSVPFDRPADDRFPSQVHDQHRFFQVFIRWFSPRFSGAEIGFFCFVFWNIS
jgi:hypothetical protein